MNTYAVQKTAVQLRVPADTDSFLAQGGQIQVIPIGVGTGVVQSKSDVRSRKRGNAARNYKK